MINSTSHTLEYKPNDIIITSSIGDVLLHHPKYLYVISFPGSTSKDLGGGASVLILTLALPRRRTECCSTTWLCLVVMVPAPACAQMRASLSHCVIARAMRSPEKGINLEVYVAQDAYGLQRADIARVLFPWLYPT